MPVIFLSPGLVRKLNLMEKYKEQFLAPESFVRIGGKILAVKQPVPGTENKDMTQKPPHKSGPEL